MDSGLDNFKGWFSWYYFFPVRMIRVYHKLSFNFKGHKKSIIDTPLRYPNDWWKKKEYYFLIFLSLFFSFNKKNLPFTIRVFIWCSGWDLNPHTLRAYASETYVSTIPPPEQIILSCKSKILCVYPPLMCRTASRVLAFGRMAPIRFAKGHTPFHHPSKASQVYPRWKKRKIKAKNSSLFGNVFKVW